MHEKPQNYPQSPQALWNIFYDFTQTPRPSKKEAKILAYLEDIAKKNALSYQYDEAGNVIIYVPGKNGRENDPSLLIQNHVDMVTDCLPHIDIDFEKDPLELIVKDGYLTANGTTLGADNGIGCAAALATIFQKDLSHPPLELLFTIDEETGLNGAQGLEGKYLKSKRMLNLDTEEWGSVYIGCAGGIDYELTGSLNTKKAPSHLSFYEIGVSGFIGGHSGLDIHEQRANAIQFMAEFLDELQDKLDFKLAEIRGGKAHNIIPRDCFAIVAIEEKDIEACEELLNGLLSRWKNFLPKEDQNAQTYIKNHSHNELLVMDEQEQQSLIELILLFPHGAHSYDVQDRSLVGVSNNFARLLLVDSKLYIQSSLRFFDRKEVMSLEKRIKSLGRMFGLEVSSNSEYPSWKPQRESKLLEKVKAIYQELYGEFPAIKAIHAGLECGILREKLGDVEVVSFGPTITGAHSPDEMVDIESVKHFWQFFCKVLAEV